MNSKNACVSLFCMGMVSLATAAVVVDGAVDAGYGAAVATQSHQTQFGDNTLGAPDAANGSELANAYAVVEGTNLFVFIAGNLESNFNKLDLFFDCRLGGQNKLRGDNPNVDFNGLNRMGDDGSLTNGLRFDTDFGADYWIGLGGGGATYTLFCNYAQLPDNAGGTNGYFLGSTGAQSGGELAGGNNPHGIRITIDNRNTNGVAGGNAPNGPFAPVTTGIELAIPLAALGHPCGTIKVCAFVNASGHDFVSNQNLPGYDTTNTVNNLGDPRNVHFDEQPGRQWFAAAYVGLTNDYSIVAHRLEPAGNGVTITWPTSDTNKVYAVSVSTNLGEGFSVLAKDIASTPPFNVYTDSVGSASSFYRVQVDTGCP